MSENLYKFVKVVNDGEGPRAVFQRPARRGLAKLLGLQETIELEQSQIDQLSEMKVIDMQDNINEAATALLPKVKEAFVPNAISNAIEGFSVLARATDERNFLESFGIK